MSYFPDLVLVLILILDLGLAQVAASSVAHGLDPATRRAVAWWLGGCSAWVASLVVLGGMTRLTRSGLSMTEWKFTGEAPPSSQVGSSAPCGPWMRLRGRLSSLHALSMKSSMQHARWCASGCHVASPLTLLQEPRLLSARGLVPVDPPLNMHKPGLCRKQHKPSQACPRVCRQSGRLSLTSTRRPPSSRR